MTIIQNNCRKWRGFEYSAESASSPSYLTTVDSNVSPAEVSSTSLDHFPLLDIRLLNNTKVYLRIMVDKLICMYLLKLYKCNRSIWYHI